MAVTLTNSDIVSRLKLLADIHLKADSGTTTSLISKRLSDEGELANSYICFINGANVGLDRIITSFHKGTDSLYFAALPTAITSSDEFCICQKGFQSDATQASLVIKNDFRNKGYDIDLFLVNEQLKEMYIYKAISLICGGLMNNGSDDDTYFINHQRFEELYDIEKSVLMADYDLNEDGAISTDEETVNTGQVGFAR